MPNDKTTIKIDRQVAKKLKEKTGIGETYSDTIKKLLEEKK